MKQRYCSLPYGPGADELGEDDVAHGDLDALAVMDGGGEGALPCQWVGGDVEGFLELGQRGGVVELVEGLLGGPVDEVVQHARLGVVGVDVGGLLGRGEARGDTLYARGDVLEVHAYGPGAVVGYGGVATRVGDADMDVATLEIGTAGGVIGDLDVGAEELSHEQAHGKPLGTATFVGHTL